MALPSGGSAAPGLPQALKPLPKVDYDALRAAFDAKAAHLLEETVNADAE